MKHRGPKGLENRPRTTMACPQANLLNTPDPFQDGPGNNLIRRVDREDLRHMTLALFEEHGRAMVGTNFAEFVVQSFVERAVGSVDARIELGGSEHDFYCARLQRRQTGSRELRCRIDLRAAAEAGSITAPAAARGRIVSSAGSGDRAGV